MWLLDANLDIQVREVLAEAGIESRTAESLGWKGFSNGELVSIATASGYTCLLTRDRLFAESATKALSQFPGFAVILVNLKQQKRPAFCETFRKALVREPIVPVPGMTIVWPSAG